MITKKEIYNHLNNEEKELNEKVSNIRLYNLKNFFRRRGVDAVFVLHKATPFVLATIIASSTFPMLSTKKPFHKDTIIEKAYIQSINSSTGYNYQRSSFDYKYDTNRLEYSTGWTLDENNLYTRTLTTYQIDDSIDLRDLDSLLSKTEQELRESLYITNIEKISKPELTKEDEMFNEPAVIITRSFTSDELFYEREENTGEDLWTSVLYISYIAIIGLGLASIRNTIFKRKAEKELEKLKLKYRRISAEEIEELKELLLIKQENLKLLNNTDVEETAPAPRKVR